MTTEGSPCVEKYRSRLAQATSWMNGHEIRYIMEWLRVRRGKLSGYTPVKL